MESQSVVLLTDMAPGLHAHPSVRLEHGHFSSDDGDCRIVRSERDATLRVEITAKRDLRLREAGIRVAGFGGDRLLVDGYHSWDWAGVRDATTPGAGWWGAIWGKASGGNALTLGLGAVPKHGSLRVRWKERGAVELLFCGSPVQRSQRTGDETSLDLKIPAGTTFVSDPIRVARHNFQAPSAILPSPPRAHIPGPRLAGWMSWNCWGGYIDLKSKILPAIPMTSEGGVVLVDDGWMKYWGDWNVLPDFGASLEDTAREIHGRNRKFGLWCAPFLVDQKSETARLHKDWLLRKSDGTLALDRRPPRAQYILDASKPEVRTYLSELGARLGRSGVDVLKIDFLYAGGLTGARENAMSDFAAMRAGIESISAGFRTAAPEGAQIWACGAPAPAVVGIADTCRSGGDAIRDVPARHISRAGIYYRNTTLDKAQIRNVRARAALWGKVLPPDFDAITLGRLGLAWPRKWAESREMLEAMRQSGGPFLVSDRPGRVGAAQIETVLEMMRTVAGTTAAPETPENPLQGPVVPMSLDVFEAGAGL